MYREQLELEIKRMCPLLASVLVSDGFFGNGTVDEERGVRVVVNCKCGCFKSDLQVPHKSLRRGIGIAEYASMSLRHCTPGIVGMVCKTRGARYVGRAVGPNGPGEPVWEPVDGAHKRDGCGA